jgi:hypothetical protein
LVFRVPQRFHFGAVPDEKVQISRPARIIERRQSNAKTIVIGNFGDLCWYQRNWLYTLVRVLFSLCNRFEMILSDGLVLNGYPSTKRGWGRQRFFRQPELHVDQV